MTGHLGHAALLAMQEAHVFDPVPLRAGLHRMHVPFDEMTGTATCESELDRGVTAMERIAVAGGSGVGKSSLVQHVLDTSTDELAVFRVPVEAEDPETVTEPGAFAGHLVRTVARHLEEAASIDGDRRRELLSETSTELTVARSRTGKAGLGLPRWVLDVRVAGEVSTVVTASARRSGADVVALAKQVIDTVSERGLRPVLVVDDSDAWLRTTLGDRTALVGPFFNRVLRMLAEEMTAALVVAVHSDYFELSGFPDAAGFLEQTIPVPDLPVPPALGRILRTRVEVLGDDWLSEHTDVVDDAVEPLFAAYLSEGGSVRQAMLLAHTALQIACQDGADGLNHHHVDAALTRYRRDGR